VKWGGLCGECDGIIHPGEPALYDGDAKVLYHPGCANKITDEPGFESAVMTRLDFMSAKIDVMYGKIQSMYEAQFPPIDKLMGGKHE